MNTKTINKLVKKAKKVARLSEITNIILGKYTFLINSPLFTIENKQLTVASEKKLQKTIPRSKYTGKLGILLPNLKTVVNTKYKTTKRNIGLASDQK